MCGRESAWAPTATSSSSRRSCPDGSTTMVVQVAGRRLRVSCCSPVGRRGATRGVSAVAASESRRLRGAVNSTGRCRGLNRRPTGGSGGGSSTALHPAPVAGSSWRESWYGYAGGLRHCAARRRRRHHAADMSVSSPSRSKAFLRRITAGRQARFPLPDRRFYHHLIVVACIDVVSSRSVARAVGRPCRYRRRMDVRRCVGWS